MGRIIAELNKANLEKTQNYARKIAEQDDLEKALTESEI